MGQNFKIMPSIPLQLGWIGYWNLRPLRIEIERLMGGEIEVSKGTPAQVNRWLSEGRVSLAPCSSVCLVKNTGNEIAFPLGISSNGAVQSVYIGLKHEDAGLIEMIRARQSMLREIVRAGQARYDNDCRKLSAYIFKMSASMPPLEGAPPPLLVTPASATGAMLARILYRLWFGEAAYDARAADTATANTATTFRRPMELLIGDEALIKRPNYRAMIDLGEMWKELTDLPFVFGVWQTTKRSLSPYWRQRILEAAEIAQARMRIEPCHYLPDMAVNDVSGHPIDLGAYWKLIQYRLGPQHFKGLALFLSLARHLSPANIDDQAVVNIMRWESLGSAAEPRL